MIPTRPKFALFEKTISHQVYLRSEKQNTYVTASWLSYTTNFNFVNTSRVVCLVSRPTLEKCHN